MWQHRKHRVVAQSFSRGSDQWIAEGATAPTKGEELFEPVKARRINLAERPVGTLSSIAGNSEDSSRC